MIKTLFYINNSPVNPPQNWQDLAIELNYGKDQFPEGNTVSITNFDWVRENFDLITNYIAGGLTGGVGIFEAPPFRIDVTDGVTTKTVFNGYIDLTDALAIKDRIKLTAKAVSHATVDWINQVASGFTFEYLASLPTSASGNIQSSKYVFVPYVNNMVPNYEQSAIATLMVFSITQSIYKEIEEIIGIITDATVPFTTVQAILKLIIKIAYLTVLIATLIKLVEDMIKFLISPVKYHAGMYVRDLMAAACDYLNMDFQSDIWAPGSDFYNEIIIPQKLFNAPSAADSSIFGFLVPDKNEQIGYYKGTFADLLEAMKIKYNAKIVVVAPPDGTRGRVIFLRKDKNALPPQYQLPDAYIPDYSYNTDELQANYLISFQTDSTELNTFQNYHGTIYQVITTPKTFNYQPFVMMKHLTEVSIPFSRATTKTDLTEPEQLFEDFLIVFDAIANIVVFNINVVVSIVDTVLKVINRIFKLFGIKIKIPTIPHLNKLSLDVSIENRKGMMLLTEDHFNVAKILVLNAASEPKYSKLHPNNDGIESASNHWYNFHYVNSFVPKQLNPAYADRPMGNQYLTKEFPSVPFDWDDFINVFANNRIFDASGNEALLESLKFNPYKQTAEVRARFGKIYTLNLQETFLDPTGA